MEKKPVSFKTTAKAFLKHFAGSPVAKTKGLITLMAKDCFIGCNGSEKFKQSTYPWVQKATGVGQKMSYILLHRRRKQENFVVFFW